MSILETPRIYFRGEISWDPVTTNNYSAGRAPAAYDEDDCEAILNTSPVTAEKVAAFRAAAVAEVATVGNWNPDGTYRSRFFNTEISGVDTGAGTTTDDPFVGAPVDFVGMLVDTEPYGAFSSQLFFDDISFGIAGGCRVFGKRANRFTDRYINFQANPDNSIIAGVASVMWQTSFYKDQGMVIDDHDSAALAALKAAMADDDVLGTTVRWIAYRTIYYDDFTLTNATSGAAAQAFIAKKLAEGGFQPNPARSLVVGTLGIWRRGESPSEPSERTLVATLADVPSVPGATVGAAFARINGDNLVLDLSNSIPWQNRGSEKVEPAKANLDDLDIVAADPPPAVAIADIAKIGFPQYGTDAFTASSGIVTIPLAAGQGASLDDMDLSIKEDGAGPTYLTEQAYRAVPDEPNCYVDEGENRSTGVQVYHRGKPAGSGLTVTWSILGSADTSHGTAITDANGRVPVPLNQSPLSTAQGNVAGIVFQVGENPTLPITGNNFSTLIQTYMYLRVLPADGDIAAMAPTWANVHDHVLSNWEAMAPCMDNWLKLGDEQQVRAYGPLIRRLTHPDAFEEFRYMPVTRDLTPGQRTLLYNFLSAAAVMEEAALGVAQQPQAPEVRDLPGGFDIMAASRSHRSGD